MKFTRKATLNKAFCILYLVADLEVYFVYFLLLSPGEIV